MMKIRPLSLNEGVASVTRALERRAGLLLLDTDLTTEADMARLLAGSGLRLHAARMAYGGATTPETLAALAPRIEAAAALLPPDQDFAAIAFACTSATAVIGESVVVEAVRRAVPGAAVVTPLSAAAAALRALGARRVSVLAPYLHAAASPVAAALGREGFDVASLRWLGMTDDRDMARLAPEALIELADAAVDPEADALFVSCTALRAAEVAAAIEARIGRPVVTSNQALAWALLRLGGHDAGRLWGLPWRDSAA